MKIKHKIQHQVNNNLRKNNTFSQDVAFSITCSLFIILLITSSSTFLSLVSTTEHPLITLIYNYVINF